MLNKLPGGKFKGCEDVLPVKEKLVPDVWRQHLNRVMLADWMILFWEECVNMYIFNEIIETFGLPIKRYIWEGESWVLTLEKCEQKNSITQCNLFKCRNISQLSPLCTIPQCTMIRFLNIWSTLIMHVTELMVWTGPLACQSSILRYCCIRFILPVKSLSQGS